MTKKKFPPKWYEVYARGTKEGDEECRFFKSLERDEEYVFKSAEALAREAKLTPERVEEIACKYMKKRMVFQNPANPEQWTYWERSPELLDERQSILEEDQERRLDHPGC